MLISAVIRQRTRRGRVNVFIDGEFVFSINEDLAKEHRIEVGRQVSSQEIEQYQELDELAWVYESALRLLAYRPRSESELRSRLVRRKLDPELVSIVIEKLKQVGHIDDAAFASFWVDNRNSFGLRGKRLLQRELRAKGVCRELIEAAVDDPGQPSEVQKATEIAQRKLPRIQGEDWNGFRSKMAAHLLRRGFEYEVVDQVVRELWQSKASPEPAPDDAPAW
jgi:regulatory protein